LKLIEEIFQEISIDNDFLNRISVAQEIIERIDKWDCIKLKALHSKINYYQGEETAKRIEEKFSQYSLDKGLISQKCKTNKN
jgi:hypothetical protein